MDENATNYDPEAGKQSSDLCNYEASLMVWFSQESADTLSAAYPLDIWIGGNSVATWQQSDALSAEPTSCGSGTGIALHTESGTDPVYVATATIWDANNIEITQWFAESFNGGECKKLKF